MAISVTNLTSGQDITDQASYSTAVISPAADSLLIVAAHNQTPATLPTVSGLSLTWTERATIVYSTTCRLTYFTAVTGASPGSGALTIAHGGTSQANCQWTVDQATGIDTATPVVQTVTTNNLASLGTSITATLAAFGSSNNRPHGAANCWNDSATISPEAGWTELAEPGPHTDDSWGNLQSMWRDSVADLTPTWTYSASVYRGAIAIEIKAAASGTVVPIFYNHLITQGIA